MVYCSTIASYVWKREAYKSYCMFALNFITDPFEFFVSIICDLNHS
jgi:hypothetical protein